MRALLFSALLVVLPGLASAIEPAPASAGRIGLFDAMEQNLVEAKLIAKSDHAARLILANRTKQQLDLQMPDAFAGVPEQVLAQFGGGGGGVGGGGGGFGGGGGGGQQSIGGGGGGIGGGGGGGFGGGGGGQFSIPPEKVQKFDLEVVCLNHGLKEPSSSKPYYLVPVDKVVERPEVVELLKALGRGELQHNAAQAATWAMQNGMSWEELASKRQGTVRSTSRPPYFTAQEMKAAFAYAQEAKRRAEAQQAPSESYSESGYTSASVE
ncbi:hypothetical protein Pla175_39780 [Pirellulimonas nuda]|uniref:Uncharacterized protein n=1 Tax=Pirellulimonas nuda TaxID=2528009 RepID=A0A518DGH1_9BACT|nr:hypothetical protein [Pirellulimonas nuda]QDU90571.1 hypothetical protein Pla175_39780 [Pirellulimonas nuda]